MMTESASELKSFAEIWKDEKDELRGKESNDERPYTALCLSGGGIRSATFNLGLIQALAREKLLDKFDYLSTVSGGGYIGAWLTSWLRESREQYASDKETDSIVKAIGDVQNALGAQAQTEPAEVHHLRNYSNYLTPRLGLASADGLVAAATGLRNLLLNGVQIWPLVIAIMLLPLAVGGVAFSLPRPGSENAGLFALVLGLLCLFVALTYQMRRLELEGENSSTKPSCRVWVYPTTMSLGMALLLLGWTLLVLFHPATSDNIVPVAKSILEYHGAWIFGMQLVVFLVSLGVALATSPSRWANWQAAGAQAAGAVVLAAVVSAAIESQLIYFALTFDPLWQWTDSIKDCNPTDGLSGCKLFGDSSSWGWRWSTEYSLLFFLLFAYPIILVLQVVSNWVFTGSSSRLITDASREWLARADGIQMGFAGFCVCWFALSFGSPVLGDWILGNITAHSDPWAWLMSVFGPAVSLIGVWFAQSARASGSSDQADSKNTKSIKDRIIDFVGSLCVPLAAILFLATFAYAAYGLVNAMPRIPTSEKAGASQETDPPILKVDVGKPRDNWLVLSTRPTSVSCTADKTEPVCVFFKFWPAIDSSCTADNIEPACVTTTIAPKEWLSAKGWLPMIVCLVLVGVAWLAGRCFNVNRYSLFGFYRERLARAYLGGARAGNGRTPGRTPDPFTKFDAKDNYPLENARQRPLHIINAGLNLGGSEELSWQERKAMSFTFSPLHCGAANLPGEDVNKKGPGAYRKTSEYAGGMSLAGAIAISGAAANPNMGYHSSPAISFLLTICDVRLGAWLGNPANPRTWKEQSPGKGAEVSGIFMLKEASGWLDAKSPWINLSDGGHFENLGIYEMVRRGCKLILAGDASADRNGSYDDLGRASRLIRTDFGVEFKELLENGLPNNPTTLPKPDERERHRRWRLFRIVYPEGFSPGTPGKVEWADGTSLGPHPDHGYLLYFKPVLLGDEPQDVRYYASTAPDFPHESTGDQFFSESQFESYRKLGELTLLNSRNLADESGEGKRSIAILESFLNALKNLYPPPITQNSGESQ